jgi:hypothetical protein
MGSSTGIPNHDVVANWADVSEIPHVDSSWTHSGLVATSGGELIGFHAGQLVAFDEEGGLRRVVSQGLTEGHGITLVRDGSDEYLWISDPGFLFSFTADEADDGLAAMFGKGIRHVGREPRVVKMTIAGEILLELPVPQIDPAYGPGLMGSFCPCGVAVDEERFGGGGGIWVADGYGSSLVHRYDSAGDHLYALSGGEGGGRFDCPHAVFIDRRPGKDPELYVADRGNHRVQVYDLDGGYRRTFGESFLNSPSGFAQWGDVLVVAELFGRLAALDDEDQLVGYVGENPEVSPNGGWPPRPGWPNALTKDGMAQPPPKSESGRFNSPHAMAVDANGNLYVSEWLIGGRYTKLEVRPAENVHEKSIQEGARDE